MIRFLLKKVKKGNIFEKLVSLVILAALYCLWFSASIFADTFLLNFVNDSTGIDALVIGAAIILIPVCVFGPFWYFQFIADREKEIAKYGMLPHFGKLFDKSYLAKVIKSETFHNYIDKDGNESPYIKVSESDKWVCILGGYIPIDLILGYSEGSNELYAIDGAEIELPNKARKAEIRSSIKSFFEERGKYYDAVPEKTGKRFKEVLSDTGADLSKADWGRLRYIWEKTMINKDGSYWRKHSTSKKFKPVSKDGEIDTTIFERVLSDNEIKKVANAITKRKVSLSRYLNIGDYKNEFSICNGIELIEELECNKNTEAIDFLFSCLNDVDEAYFLPAIELLKTTPHDICTAKIEENARAAYENEDALRLAGLLFLSKELKYDIEYIKQVKESKQIEEATIKKFELDSQYKNDSDDIPQFTIGNMAYLNQ